MALVIVHFREKGPMRRVEPNEEAPFFPKCMMTRCTASYKPLPNNTIFLDDKTFWMQNL